MLRKEEYIMFRGTKGYPFKPKRGNYFAWFRKNPILEKGEFAIAYLRNKKGEITHGTIYIGDGKSKFSNLKPFIGKGINIIWRRRILKELNKTDNTDNIIYKN